MRARVRRRTLILLLAVAAGCGGDSTAPAPGKPPGPSPNDGLWTASASVPLILRFSPDQLVAGGTPAPATSLTTPSAELFPANGIAFDADGTMWIASQGDSLLIAFAPALLAPSGSRAASVVIASEGGSLSLPTALAFDAQRRLWVANFGNGTIARFDPAQLATSGAPAPSVVITGVLRPRGLAFDADGSLWVSDGVPSRVVKFGAAKLAASGAPVPDVILRSGETTLAGPSGLAFDAAGSLWVANLGAQTVVAFSASQLAASGSPAPHVVLSQPESLGLLPVGVAFDGDGSLWLVSVDGSIVKYDRTLLGESGAPLPSVALDFQGLGLFWSAAFWPRPAGLVPR